MVLLPPCVITGSECRSAWPGGEGSSHVVLLLRLGRARLCGCVGACMCVQVRRELAGAVAASTGGAGPLWKV